MLWLIVGIVIGMVVALAALRPRLAEVGGVAPRTRRVRE